MTMRPRWDGSPEIMLHPRGYSLDADGDGGKTRAQKAYEAFEQEEAPGFLESFLNTWHPVLTFGEDMTSQIDLNGGVVLVFKVGDPFTAASDRHDFGLLWDDTIVAAPVQIVEEGDRVTVRIEEARGKILSVWLKGSLLTENNVFGADQIPVQLVDEQPITEWENVLAREKKIAEESTQSIFGSLPDGKQSPFDKFLDGIFSVEKTIGVAGVIVAGIVVYLWFKD